MPNDCNYIRKLVRAKSILPGSIEQLVVDTHLAQCAECRRQLNMPSPNLLGDLLNTPPAPQSPKPKPASPQPVPQPRKPKPVQPQPQPPKIKPVTPQPAPQSHKSPPANPQPLPRKIKPAKTPPSRTAVWVQSTFICIATILISYVVVMGVRSGWAAFRVFRNLNQISTTDVSTAPTAPPTTTDITPTATVSTATPVPAFVLPAGSDQPITVLLLGSDRRPQEKTPSRTDAVMLLRINPQTQRVAFLSFPRDLIVSIPGYGSARINAAHVYGDIYPALGGGEKLATKTVSQLIGVPIDYTVLTDFAGFINIIDTLGGVPVNITKELYDSQFPTMDYKYREVSFHIGTSTMDGVTALTYSRIRHPDNDFERTKRQQQVITGIAKRLQTGNFVETLETTANITDALIGHAHTDMPRDLIIAMAWQMRAVPTTNFSYHTFTDIYYGTGDDRYAMYPVAGAIKRIVTQWLSQ
jgi:LCP family protein required for cell wall assembly